MGKVILILTIFAIFLLSACPKSVENTNLSGELPQNVNSETASTDKGSETAEFKSEPAGIVADSDTKLIVTVKNLRGETIRDLAIVHEKPMHLIVVSEDLSEFYHLHPEPQADGGLAVNFKFPHGGKYQIYADFTPNGGNQIVKSFPAQVSGEMNAQNKLVPDTKFERTVETIKVRMATGGVLESNKETMLGFSVFDAENGELASGMEKYLGETAHFVIISQNLKDFVHAHSMSMDNVKSENPQNSVSGNKTNNKLMDAPPDTNVSAHITFPNAGIYRIFAEFKRSGKVIAVPFTVEVKKGETDKMLETVKIPDGAFKIVVTKDGFTPNEISLSKNKFQKLAFLRVDQEICEQGVVFAKINTLKKLPVGAIVTIDLPKDQSTEMNFSCDGGKFKGKVILQ